MKKNSIFAISLVLINLISCDSISEKITAKATEVVIESAMGDSVKVDINEDGLVNLSVTTDEGTTTLNMSDTKIPDDFPSDIYFISDANRGVVAVIDTPDGKMVSLVDTLDMTLEEARAKIKDNMNAYKLEFETNSEINANLMFKKEGVKSFTISLNVFEGKVLCNYGVMY